MSNTLKKNILISEPGSMDLGAPFLPYIWGILKTYCERREGIVEHYEWLDPIYKHSNYKALLQPYEDIKIDVAGLSCFTWNWDLQCLVAKELKSRNPNCLIIAGGPEPDYKDQEIFLKHPYIDVIAVRDGEIPFYKILRNLTLGLNDFSDIGGLYLPTLDKKAHTFTGPAEVPTVFDSSPFVAQEEYYKKLIDTEGYDFAATWETNRGCPYSCSFCDWGSNTMTKVRRFDMERVEADIEWLGKNKVCWVFLADANFGIIPRDLEIADRIVDTYEEYGFPNHLIYSNAKNNPDRTVEIAKKFYKTGLLTRYVLSIQHTNENVLAAMDRANISTKKQIDVVKNLMDHGVTIDVQLILGIPGDTYETWKECFSDLMDWGIHTFEFIYHYHVLPNAPVAEPDFVKKWQIECGMRYTQTYNGFKREKGPPDPDSLKNQIILSSKSFNKNDWAKMNAYGAAIKALHSCSLTRCIAMYLKLSHGVEYKDFYGKLIDEFCASKNPTKILYERMFEQYRRITIEEDAIEYMDVEQFPNFQFQLDPSRWLYTQICLKFDEFFDSLRSYLLDEYPYAENLSSVINYQKNLVILPSYNRATGKSFSCEHDWLDYFNLAKQTNFSLSLGEPRSVPGAHVEVCDETCSDDLSEYPLDFDQFNDEEKWIQWIERTVIYRNASVRNNFQQLQLNEHPTYETFQKPKIESAYRAPAPVFSA